MRWWRRPGRDPIPLSRRLDLDDLEPATLEVLELDADGRRIGEPAIAQPVGEVAYRRRTHDPTGLAGIWEALERA